MSFDAAYGAAGAALKATMGRTATYTASAGAAQSVIGIFDAAHVFVDFDGDGQISSTGPALDVRILDLIAPPVQGAAVTVAGTAYEVLDVQPDGRGWSLLRLVEV